MALQTYRGNLSATVFPFLTELGGQSIVIPGSDQNFIRQLYSPADPDKDVGVPAAFYLENVMPTGFGYQSIGWDSRISAYGIGAEFSSVFQVINNDGNGVLISYGLNLAGPSNGFFVYGTVAHPFAWELQTQWWNGSTLVDFAGDFRDLITVAHVSGTTYIYIANHGCFKWSDADQRFEAVDLVGLTEADILGIVAANGYLLAYSLNFLAWSSTIDPTDFVPSLITGAGGGSVELAKAPLTFAGSTNTGIIIFTELNAVSGTYTGNSRAPFAFQECVSCGGLTDQNLYAGDNDSEGNSYAYTLYGLQAISNRSAKTIAGDLTDFISGQIMETFDSVTNTWTQTELGDAPLLKHLFIVGSRYLVLSYGVTELTHAIILDTVLKRYGKVKTTHVDCFEFFDFNTPSVDTAKKLIAFCSLTGVVTTVSFDLHGNSADSNGVLALGKFQYVRSRMTNLQAVVLESMNPVVGSQNTAVQVIDLPTMDGKTFLTPVSGYIQSPTGANVRVATLDSEALNHTILIKGAFHLDTIVLQFFPTSVAQYY